MSNFDVYWMSLNHFATSKVLLDVFKLFCHKKSFENLLSQSPMNGFVVI